MQMSYDPAWLHVKNHERKLQGTLVQSSRGGHEYGGATRTDTGKEALSLYRRLEEDSEKATRACREDLLKLVVK